MGDQCGSNTEDTYDPSKFKGKLSEYAESMGMDATCETEAKQRLTTAQMSGSASIGFLAETNFGASMTDQESSHTQKGCGSFIMNAANIYKSEKNLQCTMNTFAEESETNVTAGQSIRIEVYPMTAAEREIINETMRQSDAKYVGLLTTIETTYAPLIGAAAANPAGLEALMEAKRNAHKSITNAQKSAYRLLEKQLGTIKMEDTTISASTDFNVKVMKQITTQQAQALEADVKKIAECTTNHKNDENNGFQALESNSKQMNTTEVTDKVSNTMKSITENINKTTVKTGANNEIVITCPGSIDFKNVEVSSNMMVDMCSQQVMDQAFSLGLSLVSDNITATSNTTENTEDNAGGEDVTKAAGEALAAQISASQGGGGTDQNMLIGGIVVALLVFAFAAFSIRSSSQPMPLGMPPPGMPPPGMMQPGMMQPGMMQPGMMNRFG